MREPLPVRVRWAGFLALASAGIFVAFVAMAIINHRESDVMGLYVFSDTPISIGREMWPWLVPLAIPTAATGVALMLGRGIRAGLTLGAIWIVIGLLAWKLNFVVAAAIPVAMLATEADRSTA